MHKLLNNYVDENLSLFEQCLQLKKMFNDGHEYVILNNVNVFGPFPEPEVPWDISEAQKIAIYNPEVTKVLRWVMRNMVIYLPDLRYKTLDVLIRIATGMLNKCDIPNEIKILFHDNMVKNLRSVSAQIVLSELPF